MSAATDARLVLGPEPTALLGAVAADPGRPLALGVTGPGGHGKSVLLRELARVHRDAGGAVRDGAPSPDQPVDPETALVVDDAHLLDDARLETLRRLVVGRRHRLLIGYRPWPRSAALARLADALKRDGQQVVLGPFTAEQTRDYLAGVPDLDRGDELAAFVHGQTGGVPRDVERLVRGLRGPERPPGLPAEPPRAAVLAFGTDLEELPPDARRLLLAVAAGVPLPVDLLGPLLDREPAAVDDLVAYTRAAGLLGADGRLAPVVRRAVVALSPATDRTAIWRRLTEVQLGRGAAVLPLVRSLRAAGALADCPAAALEAAAEEALGGEPALSAELFAAATAAGLPAGAREAVAAALAGDLEAALRLANRLLATAPPPVRAEAATVAATALAHRGQVERSVELYRWSRLAPSAAFAAVGALALGRPPTGADLPDDPAGGPPTLHASAARLMAEGVRESVSGPPTTALSRLVQATALLEPDGRRVLLPDSPAALAALTAVHCAELDIAEGVLDRAVATGIGGPLMVCRHRLLQAWILMVRGQTAAAADRLAAVTAGGRPLESRDLLLASALRLGIARRTSDVGALQRGWGPALEAVVRHPVDLFTLLPLGELAVAGARLGDLDRLKPYLREAWLLLDRLDGPALWSAPLHWTGLHAAILTEEPAVADAHVAALLAAADHSRYAAVAAAAAASWVEVLRGVVDPVRVEAAARGLHDAGLCWDAARLAGQAAIRTSDRRAMTTLLECARVLQARPAARTGEADDAPATDAGTGPTRYRLSDREHEVAELVLAGLTYREIGDRLFISAKTVEHHVARMRSRLNCANRAELLALLRTVVADRSSAPGRQPWPEREPR
ncbi:LuxR family transcriptional regulator [Micromonospora terminaliae]|uniref:LuxR family transcriptional regulator n=1 Tax=Micromonospora terminaliae TaxID=1914461 RepID=A0AAJ3DHE8_9ACTN|nr:LuxR C-terminal-related transcriptional regulator [Micromonospora terminaliae]NES26524.1 LuxR family transcriptional regulator [Micromonospora terminaliae]QGL50696.1 LuxR family transcriptional regulator [Micromonospora terminaliae]